MQPAEHVIVEYNALESLFPYSECQSPFCLSLCGKPLALHFFENVMMQFPGTVVTVSIEDTYLRQDPLSWELLRPYAQEHSEFETTEDRIPANRLSTISLDDFYVKDPWDLLPAMHHIINIHKYDFDIHPDVIIETNVHVDGNVSVGSGSKICRGASIMGDVYIGNNCIVGYNSVIRGPCNIEDECCISNSAEIKNAIIQRNTMIGPVCYVGDSIIGHDCMLGALTRTSNVRLDKKAVTVMNDNLINDTDHMKLGCVIGNDVNIGVGVIIMPGRILGNNIIIDPNIVIMKNCESSMHYYAHQEIKKRKIF